MKKYIFISYIFSASLFLGTALHASPKPIKVFYYEAEEKLIYEVKGCVPGSDAGFYNDKQGSRCLKIFPVNADSNLKMEADRNFNPALVVNMVYSEHGGKTGSGMVAYTGTKEFVLKDLALDNTCGHTTLKWNAAVNDVAHYKFEILQSTDGKNYSVLQAMPSRTESLVPYFYDDMMMPGRDVYYKVKISNTVNGLSYTSKPLHATGATAAAVQIYPTMGQDKMNVIFNTRPEAANYQVINDRGEVLKSGHLENANTSITTTGMAAGNYMVKVAYGNHVETFKFIKQ